MRKIPSFLILLLVALSASCCTPGQAAEVHSLQAGAAMVDISPATLPALRNGSFLQASADRVDDPLHARSLVISDGKEIIAIVIVDSCMFPRTLCDEIKRLATKQTGIPTNRILISATHTHTAPSAMTCLGCGPDEAYVKYVPARVAQAIADAHKNLQPAKLGWAVVDASALTNCRRWITRSDRMGTDPFGGRTVRAMMHPGYQNPNYTSPAGPIDPWLSVLSVVSAKDDTPLCVMANLSMHYFSGSRGFSADYYGEVARMLAARIGTNQGKPASGFVGIMSQGTSGDLHWMNYSRPRQNMMRQVYSSGVADRILQAWKTIEHRSDLSLAMAEKRLTIDRRTPSPRRLDWARKINKTRGDVPPHNQVEVYAKHAAWIHENPKEEVVLQAVRIGELGITAIPNEVYGITGLKLKRQSPLAMTFNLELANGAAGYIPPPEQHRLGGYTTWPARSAGLDEKAEPLIVETLLGLLESVSEKKRQVLVDPPSAYSRAVIDKKPIAYWRLGDINSTQVTDAAGKHHSKYQGGVALYLPGPSGSGITTPGYGNRAVYLAGGHIEGNFKGHIAELKDDYSVSMWFWNGLPTDARDVTGTLLSSGEETLQIAGKAAGEERGRLVFQSGEHSFTGKTPIASKQWHQVTITRAQQHVLVYLDGNPAPEIDAQCEPTPRSNRLWVGSNRIAATTFDGKVDEVAVFDRAIAASDIVELYKISGVTAPSQPKPTVVLSPKPSNAVSQKQYAASGATREVAVHSEARRQAEGFKPLFNGKDLSGFYVLLQGQKPRTDPNRVYQVRDGTIHCYADTKAGTKVSFGVLVTEKEYSHYHLRFEYKWGEKKFPPRVTAVRDAGLLYHVVGPDIVWPTSVESQVQEGDTGDLWTVRTRADTTIDPKKKSPNYHPSAEGGVKHTCGVPGGIQRVFKSGTHERDGWNVCEVIVRGDRAVHIVNGHVNNRLWNIKGPDPKNPKQWVPLTKGKIAFQAEYAECFYRNIEIKELKPDEAYPEPDNATGEKPEKSSEATGPTPTNVDQALKAIHVPDGFEVQLVAAEPLVMDPVAIDWGPDGKLWVVEMADYPLGTDGKGKPGGRVRFLEDTNGDGKYDKSSLFAEGLSFPNGVLVWGRGILVTAAPEIVYLEDSTGDGRADVRRVLYSGFLEGNQQLRVNGLRWGLDNWVYCASGSHHAGYGKANRIVSQLTGIKHQIGSRDFRIQPDSGAFDPQSGPSQYGRNRDDWGNWFGVQNSLPLWHYVLADQNIRRNPHFAPPNPKRQVVTPANPKVYPASKLQKRFHNFNQSGRFTSACSAIIYRDNLLFDCGTDQHAFTCEPFHNLVQHNLITDDGVSFQFRRDPGEAKTDFFASEDRWCRPVMARTGPDGALWIVDMYRYMIEHPEFLPQNGKDELRPWFRSGENRGRIYRVVRSDRPARTVPRLVDLSPKQIVAALESPNGWQRDTAQRMLVKSKQTTAIAPLVNLATNSKQPLARLHALWTLDGLGALPAITLEAAIADSHAGVRRNAVRIASRVLVDANKLARLAGDSDAKVRLELASTLGAYDDQAASAALAKIAMSSCDDPYITSAVMSSLNQRNVSTILAEIVKLNSNETNTLQVMGQAVAMGKIEGIGRVIEHISSPQGHNSEKVQFDSLARILNGLAKRNLPINKLSTTAGTRIAQTIQRARTVADDLSVDEEIRAKAIQLLGREPAHLEDDFRLMESMLVPQSSVALQQAVVSYLARRSEPSVAEVLLSGWGPHSPKLRSQILDVLASRKPWAESLRQHLEAGTIRASELGAPLKQRLLASSNNAPQWQKALAAKVSTNRAEVLRHFQPVLQLKGDTKRGAILFRNLCINCHKIKEEGHEVGPQLASITNKTKKALLSSILDPSAAVEAKYLSYSILTDDGRTVSGKLDTETGSSITLLAAGGKRETVLRRDIEELQASTKSLMPEGLEQGLKPQDLADLIQFVRDTFR